MDGLRYVGWIAEMTDEDLVTLTASEFECCAPTIEGHGYALDALYWRKFDAPYWAWFRQAAG
jgi:hypothetical protein